ncbi:MAG TPA: terminase family protein [Ktedonobacterales bacterium]|nr:terminase family protein [Ktedonobacterales bacterium]
MEQKVEHHYRWSFWARDKQLAPEGDWVIWLILAGRGWGKTRTGAEWIQREVSAGRRKSLALIGPTTADVRDVMIEGESGLCRIAPPWFRPEYHPSRREVEWPNGAKAITYSAEDPDQLRGPNIDGAWCDELAAWKYAQEAYDMLMFTLRSGADPRAVVTTTPRPTKIVRELVQSPNTHVTRGRTYDNIGNLAPVFVRTIIAKYEGTRLGRQELEAEILDDNPGALWKREPMIEALRVTETPDLIRVVVAIDPAVTSGEGSDETGIIVAGLGVDSHGYILDDRSLRASPDAWAREAVAAYHTRGADRIIAETNNGGDLVASVIHTVDPTAAYSSVRASRAKVARAEPVAALYEQGRVHHVGAFAELEDQLCQWTQGEKSPDRLDALVWALTALMLSSEEDDMPAAGPPIILPGRRR